MRVIQSLQILLHELNSDIVENSCIKSFFKKNKLKEKESPLWNNSEL